MSASRRGRKKRSLTGPIIVILVLVTGVVGYYIFTQSNAGNGTSSGLIGTAASPTILGQISGVSDSTLGAVSGLGVKVASPSNVNQTLLTINGKPEVLYIGAEYCPFCAVERWSMIMALDRFGNFSGLEYMQSSSSDTYPNTYSFSFVNATYTSKYISFVSVEQLDRAHNPLQTTTSAQNALMTQYDSSQQIPFVDVGNKYFLVGSQDQPTALRVGQAATGAPYNWTQIASQLNTPGSIVAQNVDESANRLIAAICKIDGGQPTSLCSLSYAITVGFLTSPSASPQPQATDLVFRGAPAKSGLEL